MMGSGLPLIDPVCWLTIEREEDLAGLTDLINGNFGRRDRVVQIGSVVDGSNARTHFVVLTSAGDRFGLKAYAHGSSSETENHVSRIASMAGVPNVAESRYAVEGEIKFPPELTPHFVAKIPWFPKPNSCDLRHEEALEDIRANCGTFARQFGAWAAFSIYTGLDDRDYCANWVWDRREHRLAAIDFEKAFTQVDVQRALLDLVAEPLPPLMELPVVDEHYPLVAGELIEGFVAQRGRLRNNQEAIRRYVVSNGLAEPGRLADSETWLAGDDRAAADRFLRGA